MTTSTLDIVETADPFTTPYEDVDDGKDHLTHIINPEMNSDDVFKDMGAQEIVDTARFLELDIVALCGYRWVPKRNPDKYPPCPRCFEIAHILMRGGGE